MNTLVLSANDIEALHDGEGLRQSMKRALQFLSARRAINHARNVVSLPNYGQLGVMPAHCEHDNLVGYKAVSVFASNKDYGINPHQGMVVLLNPKTGGLRAILDGSTLTALRTAAVSAVATQALSRMDAKVLGVIGAGR